MAAAVILGAQARHRRLEEEDVSGSRSMARSRSMKAIKSSRSMAREGSSRSPFEEDEEDVPLYLRQAAQLSCVKNIDHGQFSLIQIEHLDHLFDVLGRRSKDDPRLCAFKLKELFQKIVDPPFDDEQVNLFFGNLIDGDHDEAGYKKAFISTQELLSILSDPNEDVKQLQVKRRERDQQVTRDYFCEQVVRIVDRDDAFMTLPITVVYMGFFVYLVQWHLRIYERRCMEDALEEFINGRDPRETADENVDDIDSLWEWIEGAGLRGPFGNVKNSTDGVYKHCLMASRNVLIGDVKLTKTLSSGAETSVWLLNSETAKTHLASNHHQYQGAAIAAATNLKDNGWSSPDIEQMAMSFSSYNEFSRMFAITTVTVPLPKLGNVYTRIDSSAVSIDPYPAIQLYIADSFFMCLALWIGFNEAKDACAALRLGCGEFADYMQFWNIVDWSNIFLCVLFGGCWLETIRCMLDDNLHALVTDYKLAVDVMALDSAAMDKITEALGTLRMRYWFMQIIMAVNVVSVVLKFFKSFQSNARLSVVSTTFKVAMVDLVHFFIMFTTIFLPFVIIGHILFGSDIQEFASVTSSINTGICALMGDFTWYIEEQPSYFTSVLPSGMPRMVVMAWYVSFMFLIFLVLLNMLLAVVLEYYTSVSSQVRFEVDAPAIWNQAWQYIKFKKETRGFLPLEALRGDLENDDDPAHEEPSVTVKSLLESWSDMSEKQAAWLMDMLDKHNSLGAEIQERKRKELHVKHLAEENKERLLELSEGILENSCRLKELEAVEGGSSDISGSLEKLMEVVTDLNVSVSKVRKEHDRLSVRVEDMMAAIPDGHRLELVEGAPLADKTANSTSSGRRAREWKKVTPATKGLAPPAKDAGVSSRFKSPEPSSARIRKPQG